jgi:hypothetical protein
MPLHSLRSRAGSNKLCEKERCAGSRRKLPGRLPEYLPAKARLLVHHGYG